MDAASAVKARKPIDGLGVGDPSLVPAMEPAVAGPVAKGAPFPAARITPHHFIPHQRRPGTSRAGALSAGWREFLLRAGLGAFTTPPALVAPDEGWRWGCATSIGRVRPLCRHPDWSKYGGVGDIDATTAVTSAL